VGTDGFSSPCRISTISADCANRSRVFGMAMLLSAADRGLNYSLQQATKETLYVPLTDVQKYKGKAVIDMLIDGWGQSRVGDHVDRRDRD
jgi:hypothetical protein